MKRKQPGCKSRRWPGLGCGLDLLAPDDVYLRMSSKTIEEPSPQLPKILYNRKADSLTCGGTRSRAAHSLENRSVLASLASGVTPWQGDRETI